MQLLPQLAKLIVEIGQRVHNGLVLEADRGGSALHLLRMEKCREGRGNVVKDAGPSLLLDLQLLPPMLHRTRRSELARFAEDVGVSADELVVDLPSYRLEAPLAVLFEQQR